MRLTRLDLIRYGKFTDKALDFGPKPADGPDLHIVYGPNEAGKSTLFAGLLDFLYGIPQQSPYGFLHGYDTMRVGGLIMAEGRERSFIRTKRQPTLLDGEERGLPETAMASLLGGLSRDDYRLMFSLDGDTLKRGGRDILASKGDLGQLLFSASAGLADLSEKLAAIEEELDGFQKPGGRSGRLADLKRDAEALKRRREEADVSAGAYAVLEESVRAAAAADEAAGAAYRAAAERDARTKLLAEALRLADGHSMLTAEEAAAAERAEALAPVLAHAALAEGLGDQVGLYSDRLAALPNRRAECDAAEAAVRALLADLRRPDETHPRELLLDQRQIARLRELIARKGPLDAKLEAAREASAAAARTLAESEAALAGSSGAAEGDLNQVRAALDTLREENPGKQRKDAEAAAASARNALADALEALRPWQGDAADLVALDAPAAADVTAVGAQIAASAVVEESARQAHERVHAAFARQQAEIDALGDAGALRDGAEHGAIRSAREASWAAHRKALDGKTADAFLAALRRDDAAVESRLTQAEAIARAMQLRVSVATAEADLKHAAQALATATAKASAARARLAEMVAAASPALKPAMSAEALNGWLKRREDALRIRSELRDSQREAADAEGREELLRAGLLKALSAAGANIAHDAETAALAAAANAMLLGAEAAKALKAGVGRAARDATDRHVALEAAQTEASDWDRAWRSALAACWLGDLKPAPGSAHVAEVLEALGRLQDALDRRAERLDRLGKIEQDLAAFEARATALAVSFDLDAGGEPLAVVRMALDRIAAASGAAEARERLAEKRADAERHLLQRLKAASLAEAEAMLADGDAPALAAEQADLALTLPLLDKQRVEVGAALLTARRALDAVGGDAQAARLAGQRANLLLEMGEEASRHLARRLGVLAMRQALRQYRDQHRSSMLEAASAAFAVMTRGAYTGLRAQADGGAEKLVAIMREGGSREADQLSTGTQYQLYLALRVAGHAEVARERTPLPFVCDDIFETFDDLRAEEAMKLLSGMAEKGQVICLTHHRHLCAIAREVVPGARLLEL